MPFKTIFIIIVLFLAVCVPLHTVPNSILHSKNHSSLQKQEIEESRVRDVRVRVQRQFSARKQNRTQAKVGTLLGRRAASERSFPCRVHHLKRRDGEWLGQQYQVVFVASQQVFGCTSPSYLPACVYACRVHRSFLPKTIFK